jgi:hypothetical protein
MAAPAARSLPVEAKSPPMAEEPQRVEATLPLVLDLYTPDLVQHFRGLQVHAGSIIYTTRISPESLVMNCIDRDGTGYVAMLFKHEFKPQLPIVRPHASLVHNLKVPDWKAWWRLKHCLCMMLTERTVQCFFQQRCSHPYKFVLDENCELGVLLRMLQDEIAAAHTGGTDIKVDIVQELHLTFHKIMDHTV